jgi:hypothetical protein
LQCPLPWLRLGFAASANDDAEPLRRMLLLLLCEPEGGLPAAPFAGLLLLLLLRLG